MSITHKGITVTLVGRVMYANDKYESYSSIPYDYAGLDNYTTTQEYLRAQMRKFAEECSAYE